LEDAKAHADEIRHPTAYQVIFREDWVTPSEASIATEGLAQGGGGADKVRSLLAKRAEIDGAILKARDERKKVDEGGPTPPPAPRTPTGGPGGGKGAGPGSPPPPTGTPNTKHDPKEERRKA